MFQKTFKTVFLTISFFLLSSCGWEFCPCQTNRQGEPNSASSKAACEMPNSKVLKKDPSLKSCPLSVSEPNKPAEQKQPGQRSQAEQSEKTMQYMVCEQAEKTKMTPLISKVEEQEVTNMSEKVIKTDQQWCRILTPEQYRVMRKKGTEPAFSGRYYNFKGEGTYRCAGCGAVLFSSDAKFDSGCGWPSFTQPTSENNITQQPDQSFGMARTEVLCSKCQAHLGHVFNDGPAPAGLRYCINSAALNFNEKEK